MTESTELLFNQTLNQQDGHQPQLSAGADDTVKSSLPLVSEAPSSVEEIIEEKPIEEIIEDKIENYINQLLASDEAGALKGSKIIYLGLCAKVEVDGVTKNLSIPSCRPRKNKE